MPPYNAMVGAAGSPDIKSAIAVLRQRLGTQGMPGQGAGPQGIDPSQVTTQGGQRGIVGRGGNFQPLGAAAQGRLNQAPAQAPGVQTFMQQNPGLTTDFIRAAAARGGMPGPGGISVNPSDPLPPGQASTMVRPLGGQTAPAPQPTDAQRTDMPGSKVPQWQSASVPGLGTAMQAAMQGIGSDMDPQQRQQMTDLVRQGFDVGMERGGGSPGGVSGGTPMATPGWQPFNGNTPGAGGAPPTGMPPQLLQQLQQLRGAGGASPLRSLVAGALGNQMAY